jgi:hypothetical protein
MPSGRAFRSVTTRASNLGWIFPQKGGLVSQEAQDVDAAKAKEGMLNQTRIPEVLVLIHSDGCVLAGNKPKQLFCLKPPVSATSLKMGIVHRVEVVTRLWDNQFAYCAAFR